MRQRDELYGLSAHRMPFRIQLNLQSTMGSINSAGGGGLDAVKVGTPHCPKMLDLAQGSDVHVVVAVDTEYRLGVETLRDGAALCAGVL